MKKREIILLFMLAVLFSVFANAQNATKDLDEKSGVDKAYQCLENQIKEKSSFSLQDAVFGILALGPNNKLSEKIEQEKRESEACWPKTCNIKDSAQVLMAYDRIGKNTKDVKDWLLSKAINAQELTWYLEIDIENHVASECNVGYDSQKAKIRIRDDMKLEGNPGSCLEIGYDGYWLRIREQCLDKEFEISCDEDFITTLVYQKKAGSTVFVSSETHSSASLGATNEKVNSKCLAIGGKCDYEGTLWAALALRKAKEDATPYMPYLVALSDDNQRYLPSAFLFILIGGEDMYADIVQKQKLGQYWDIIGSPYNRFYDSALALLALSGTGAGEVESAKNYLLSVQTREGCWNNNNIRDTGFILYAAWQRISGTSGGGGLSSCESTGHFCEAANECLNSGGSVLEGFVCQNFRDSCCTIKVQDVTCAEKRGLTCASNQRCTGIIEQSADGSCCINGACEDIPSTNLCAIADGICKTSCSDSEDVLSESCPDFGDVCCKEKEEEPKTGISTIWIVILIVLILFVILAIIYRHKLQIWWHSRKRGKGETAMAGARRPPGFQGMMPMPRYPARGPAIRTTRGIKSKEDGELEETMRKLKEMSK